MENQLDQKNSLFRIPSVSIIGFCMFNFKCFKEQDQNQRGMGFIQDEDQN